MKTIVRLGFNPLNDCAPIVVAQELGFFKDEGLEVILEKEIAWANIRDKLCYGLIDGAHILAPIPLAGAMSVGPNIGEMIVPMALNMGGNSFVVSNKLYEKLAKITNISSSLLFKGKAIKEIIEERRKKQEPRLILAVPFIHSSHNFVIRNWLSICGIDVERQIQILVLPPSKMAQMLSEGLIDGFCAGSPWPQTTQIMGEGKILFSDADYWTLKPEKVLALRKDWAKANPLATRVLCRAIMRAGNWCSKPENQNALFEILAQEKYVNAPLEAISLSFTSENANICFDPQIASFPWISHAKWFLEQFEKHGMSDANKDFDEIARKTYAPELWGEIARTMGLNVPNFDEKTEGVQSTEYEIKATPKNILMPRNEFFDCSKFG